MRGTIDGYTQMRVYLKEEDIEALEKNKEVIGEVWRTTGDTLPLRMYLKEDMLQMRAEGVPTYKGWEEKEAYEIDINLDYLRKIKNRELVGSGMPAISLRTVMISLEDVF